MGSTKEDKMSLADFEISPQGQIICCPEGHAPVKLKKISEKVSVLILSIVKIARIYRSVR